MTPAQTCKRIYDMISRLPDEVEENIKEVYAVTWSIVFLHHQGLVNPRHEASERLADMLATVERENDKQYPRCQDCGHVHNKGTACPNAHCLCQG